MDQLPSPGESVFMSLSVLLENKALKNISRLKKKSFYQLMFCFTPDPFEGDFKKGGLPVRGALRGHIVNENVSVTLTL